MGKPLHWIVILQLVSFAFAYRYDPWYRADAQRPVDVITDVINDLGVKILQQYSTRGNVAFSPTGIAFVLAALYEGSAGRGSQQIAEAIGLPPNRDVTRIGFRDIHRRLRSYLNADGFLGGLTLSKENTRLRPEYEDILRFYGFDLSSIEQEANVTVSMGDSSGTTELPTSTIDSTTLPVETINTGDVPSTTTMVTDAITTLPPTSAETTIAPSIATDTTQQTVTMPMDATDVQSTLAPTASPGAVAQNILPTQSGDSLTTVTSGESAQPPPSAGVESVAGSPNTVTPAVDTGLASTMDSQMSPSTVTMVVLADNQNPPTTPMLGTGDNGTNETVTNVVAPDVNIITENVENTNLTTPGVSNANIQMRMNADTTTAAATDAGTTVSMGGDTEVPSTFAINTEIPTTTNTSNSDLSTTIVADTSTEVLEAASTMIVTMMPVSTSVTNATSSTPDSLTSAISTDNGVTSQSSIETSMSANNSAGNTPGMTAINDLTTMPMTTVIASSEGATIMMPPVQMTNMTSSNLTGNPNSTIANSTMNSIMPMDNQTAASLVDENTISMNRKKKAIESEIELVSNLKNMMNDNTVKDESSNRSPNLRKRRARSPRGYFSSYPDEGIWMQDLEIWKSYNTVNPSESSVGDSTAEISFLVNGCDVSSVSASRYIAVLPFAYFPSLHAVALEFPLDDPRYNIILLMPTDKTDTHRLARELSGKSLRSLRKRLQLTWVRATIPSFMLRGFVTLTSFLQRLGISDVFEPRVADLSPMTSELGVYARDVQQSIGVNIRNYMKPDRTHSRESSNVVPPRRDYYRYLPPGNGLFERAGPVPFTALHPFLYFIVDTETSVSLIAGRVDDPLNSRIL